MRHTNVGCLSNCQSSLQEYRIPRRVGSRALVTAHGRHGCNDASRFILRCAAAVVLHGNRAWPRYGNQETHALAPLPYSCAGQCSVRANLGCLEIPYDPQPIDTQAQCCNACVSNKACKHAIWHSEVDFLDGFVIEFCNLYETCTPTPDFSATLLTKGTKRPHI